MQPSIAQTRHTLPLQDSSSILPALPGVGAGPWSSAPSTVPSLPQSPLPSYRQHRGNRGSIYFAYFAARLTCPPQGSGSPRSPGRRERWPGQAGLCSCLPAVISPGCQSPGPPYQGGSVCSPIQPAGRAGAAASRTNLTPSRAEWGGGESELQVRTRGCPGRALAPPGAQGFV